MEAATSYASLKDVAARAGVSFQTASKVLNGRSGAASPTTVDRVLAAAQELRYVPSAMARRLVSQSAPLVGIVSEDFSDVGLSRFLVGAQRVVHERGKEAFVVAIQPSGDPTLAVRQLLEHRVDGILVIAPSMERDRRFAKALTNGLPIVSLNHFPRSTAALVGSDHGQTGALAAEVLIRHGHRHVAAVTGPRTREVTVRRSSGFRTALHDAGVPLPPSRVVEADWTAQGAHEATHRLMSSDPKTTAIFAHNDVMAMGVLRALADRGVRVPEDCSVVGCDDMPFAAHLVPALTTVRIPFDETGARAAELLLDRMAGATIPRRELLPVRLIERQSVGPAPAGPIAPRRVAVARSAGRSSKERVR